MEQNMIIYHGSQQIVETPKFGIGKEYNDYGQGFYCTENIELAKEWACPVKKDGYANKYRLTLDEMNVMHLTRGKFNILNWLAKKPARMKAVTENLTSVRQSAITREILSCPALCRM